MCISLSPVHTLARAQVGPPKVILREEGGKREEPYDEATVDVPEEFVGACVDLLGSRKGAMMDMVTENVRRSHRNPCQSRLPLRSLRHLRRRFDLCVPVPRGLRAAAPRGVRAPCRARAACGTRSRRAGCWA